MFRTDIVVKEDEFNELKYSDDNKNQFKSIIKKSILDFEHHNETVVKRIIVLRDGISDHQRKFVQSSEIT